jgi:hypothetical protein
VQAPPTRTRFPAARSLDTDALQTEPDVLYCTKF